MPQTNLQRKLTYYERVVEEAKNSPLSTQYKTVCNALEGLVDLSKKLNNPETKMTPTIFEELTGKYKNVQKACSDYLGESKPKSSFEKGCMEIIKNISRGLTRDMSVLEKCDPKEPGSLSEVIGKSRSHTIFLKESDIKREGGALSSRIPLKTPSGKKGFFTPMTTYNIDEKWIEQIGKHIDIISKFSKDSKSKMERLKTDEKLIDIFCNFCPSCTMDEYIQAAPDKETIARRVRGVVCAIGIAKNEREAKEKLKNLELKSEVFNFIDSMSSLVNKYNFMQAAGIKKNAVISDRNCAMSEMAKLLGCTGILANSAPMTVMIDGEKVEGVFMETVDGTDVNRLKEDDDILSAKSDSFEDTEALGQVVDLQVLDYICGNIDRHTGNMIYQFAKNENGKVVLKGIKGIDNDCAFGTPDIESNKPIQDMVKPENMQFIRTKMVERIAGLNPNMIEMQLAHCKLSDEEKKAVWDRVEKVKEAVMGKKIKEIGKKPGDMNLLLSTKTEKDNYLKKIRGIAACCEKELYHMEERGDNEVHYVKDRRMANKVMFNKHTDIAALREQMNKAKAIFYNTSEYNMMKKRFEKIEKLTNELRKEYKNSSEIPEPKAAALEEAYADLADKALKYIKLKKLVPSTERGQMRMKFAQDLLDFAHNTMDEMTLDPEKEAGGKDKEPMVKKEEELSKDEYQKEEMIK